MIIHEVDGHFAISQEDTWLPGAYATRRAALLTLGLPDLTLAQMQARANARMPDGKGGIITEDEVRRAIFLSTRHARRP
jgi:hypothetical protein